MNSQKVSVEWLKEHLNDPNVRIVDCQFVFGEPEAGRNLYEQAHVPGAVFFDLEADLAGPKQEHGGKHPLPDVAELAEKLGRAGIDKDTTVVAYDAQDGAMAARFWWLMQYLGHEKTYLLDGGLTLWTAEEYPVATEVPAYEAKTFTPHVQKDMLVTIDRVRETLEQGEINLIDSRDEKRYLGIEEPLYPVAGHIPGAVNHPWKNSLNEDGTWKSAEEQAARFAGLDKERETVVYCGSGITACPNVMALREAGFKNVKLYMGSWSDWTSYPENPIEKGLAVLEKTADGYTARFERRFAQDAEQVWAMLTENEKLAQWFSELRVGDLREGGVMKFDMGNGTFEEMAILDLKPLSVLAYTWGEDAVRFELEPGEAGGCQLVLTETIGQLTNHTPKDLAGWHVCLDVIAALLDGRTLSSREDVWKKWYEKYVQAVEVCQA